MRPYRNVGPGQILQRYMRYREWDKKRLSDFLDVSPEELEEIFCNKREIDEELAKRLGLVFENSPDFWINLNKNYRVNRRCRL